MKRRIVIGSIIAVFLIAFIPVTNAIQMQSLEHDVPTSYVSYDTIKNMDDEELVVFIGNLIKDDPQMYETFQHYVDEMDNALISLLMTKQLDDIPVNTDPDPQLNNDNQTLLEKIFWNIFKYKALRLSISILLYINFQSKFTLWRTMTWGIRLLRWVKIGILLGIIEPGESNPYTPTIVFQQDKINRTLTVLSVNPDAVLWNNIAEIGEGSCDPLPEGIVTVGDTLTNCSGIIVLTYLPTDEILGIFEFD